ncbi:pyridoxamine 5'-phosphate oxidase-like protein [Arthrobacter crystallopoietes BAB-32]|uniref:Pyridoxamine 5'-phosphate oxidase-like protein n=1 Tax=Arthrobacter crystallopoietes BAB-32 TaxID=1246476 RepID=N1UY87_9MICC|nr:pyridoxamine 5'-phosphate oxidase family protein [Arthrobacter crystallopoietes]EMY32792.1 pyridoxamine 5'-phosphate oxidase-like protein [Arthrobacter crystallopoietes BAB-32]
MTEIPQVPDSEHPTQVLTEAECWQLLAGTPLGRLAVTCRNEPDIFPVNFWPHGSTVLLHGSRHVRSAVGQSSPHVVLEADGRDAGTVWSVMAKGTFRQVGRPEAQELVQQRQLRPWTFGPECIYLELRPDRVTGRRIAVGPEERY